MDIHMNYCLMHSYSCFQSEKSIIAVSPHSLLIAVSALAVKLYYSTIATYCLVQITYETARAHNNVLLMIVTKVCTELHACVASNGYYFS